MNDILLGYFFLDTSFVEDLVLFVPFCFFLSLTFILSFSSLSQFLSYLPSLTIVCFGEVEVFVSGSTSCEITLHTLRTRDSRQHLQVLPNVDYWCAPSYQGRRPSNLMTSLHVSK